MRAISAGPTHLMLLLSAQFLAVMLLSLGSCADKIAPIKSYNELVSSDESLTEDERKAVISELQKKQRQKQQLKEHDGDQK